MIENIEPPTGAMARLADLQRRFRLPALGEAARSGKTVNVLGSVRTTTVVSAGPASASHYAVTVLGLVSPGSMADAMQPTMNPAIDATLAKLGEGRTMRFVDGRVRIAQPY
ncbi:MAG: hypothetical protein KC731_33810, partial [Myxococcales bacterium]|nr:hypothetical protein [Myxococcales bacterium]